MRTLLYIHVDVKHIHVSMYIYIYKHMYVYGSSWSHDFANTFMPEVHVSCQLIPEDSKCLAH